MKKILSIILVIIMVLSAGIPVIAAAPEIYRAVYLGGNGFFVETLYTGYRPLNPDPTTVTNYEISKSAGELSAGKVYEITVDNSVVIDAKLSEVGNAIVSYWNEEEIFIQEERPLEGIIAEMIRNNPGYFSITLDNGSYIWYLGGLAKKGVFKITQHNADSATVETMPYIGNWYGLKVGDKVKMYGYGGGMPPVDSLYVCVEDLALTTDAGYVKAGDTVTLNAAFGKAMNSNVATLTYTFDPSLFEYIDFDPAAGVSIINTDFDLGTVKMIVMKQDYDFKDIGDIVLRAKLDAGFADSFETVSLSADYVVKDGDSKEVKTAGASANLNILPYNFTLIDLSNIIDWFGFVKVDGEGNVNPDWNTIYTYWDFNNNSEIDIFDISFVAKRII